MTTPDRAVPAATSSEERAAGPRDRALLAGAAAAAWVLAWLLVQLHVAAGWALPYLPGSR